MENSLLFFVRVAGRLAAAGRRVKARLAVRLQAAYEILLSA
jgi:hypothetical protein